MRHCALGGEKIHNPDVQMHAQSLEQALTYSAEILQYHVLPVVVRAKAFAKGKLPAINIVKKRQQSVNL